MQQLDSQSSVSFATFSSETDLFTYNSKSQIVQSAYDIVETVKAQSTNFILSTSFGHYSAALLKIVSDVAPNVPIVWVDSGYNTNDTYRHCDELTERLNLNLRIYHPQRSASHRKALGANPMPKQPGYEEFVQEIKLEPFQRALAELQPSHWITGIRAEETEHRRSLGVESDGPNGIKKVAPLFHWNEMNLTNFITGNQLPFAKNYQDPTKPAGGEECGLHCVL